MMYNRSVFLLPIVIPTNNHMGETITANKVKVHNSEIYNKVFFTCRYIRYIIMCNNYERVVLVMVIL